MIAGYMTGPQTAVICHPVTTDERHSAAGQSAEGQGANENTYILSNIIVVRSTSFLFGLNTLLSSLLSGGL